MSLTTGATPLNAVMGVVLDTETTGLDAGTARLIEIGLLGTRGAEIRAGVEFSRRLDPGVAIDPGSTAVHGITNADVAGEPSFADIAETLAGLLDGVVIIGHRVTYDLRIIEREMGTAGRRWAAPRMLDVELLGRLVAPDLASHGLGQLAEWLGLPRDARHSPLDDARLTRAVYGALLPRLRALGIRTLAEAEVACRAGMGNDGGQSGRALHAGQSLATPSALVSIDSFPYRHLISEVMSAPPIVVPVSMPLGEAVRLLVQRNVSSVLVGSGTALGDLGIVTERDCLRALDRFGSGALERPVGELAHRPLQAVGQSDFVYRAIGRMDRLNLRHLAVTDSDGNVVGVVTTRNLLRHRAARAIVLGDEIDRAETAADLASAWARLSLMAASLAGEGVDPRAIARVISSEVCALTRRATEIAEARMADEGWGAPPVPYAVMVLGSAGRGESLLAADQDNAIVYAMGEPGGPEDTWFAELGRIVADILDEVGVPYCKGGIMARNPEWRKSVAAWKVTIDGWVRRQRPQDLLNVDIFFDGVGVRGDVRLADEIWRHAYAKGSGARDFVKLLSVMAADWKAPLTIFGGIRTDDQGRVDLKKGGIMPIFTAARVLSIRHDVHARATPARLEGIAAKGIGAADDIAALIEAHRTILGFMLSQQLADAEAGVPLSPRVDLGSLDARAQRQLREALGRISIANDLVTEGRI